MFDGAGQPRDCTAASDGPCLLIETPGATHGVSVSGQRLIYTIPAHPDCADSGRGHVCESDVSGGASDCFSQCGYNPYAVSVRGASLVWGHGVDGQLVYKDGSGAEFNSLNDLVGDGCVTLTDDRIYFMNDDQNHVGHLPAIGSAVSAACCGDSCSCDSVSLVLTERSNLRGTVASETSLLWVEDGTLHRADAEGQNDREVTNVPGVAGCMAVATDLVFVSDVNGGEISAWSEVGECRVSIATGIHGPESVAVDETHLYWTSKEGVWRMRRPF